MIRSEPEQLWWTADQLAASGLPEMPGTKQGVNLLATREDWRAVPSGSRKKAGRGGGWQYHWSVLPETTRKALLVREAPAPDAKPDRGNAWTAFDALPEKDKATARDRLNALEKVELLQSAGATKVAAADLAAAELSVKPRSIFNWFKMVEGIAREDRLAYLVKRHRSAARKPAKAQDATAFMKHLKSLFLRLELPTFKESYRIALKLAHAEGWTTLTERTAQRRLERDVPRVTRVYLREGEAGLQRCFPAQIRDRSGLVALEGVNADCHKIDIFVEWPDGTQDRPQIVAFQDLYSNKILSWRVDHDPNKVMVMSAFGEMIENWGIPRHCLFDNGREFANKWLTAGTKTRFRFTINEDYPLGVLPLLGVKVHWARPAHGQAKPIERGFRDFASDIAKDPRFAGAYVGNRPDAKPENYKSRIIPLETFLKVVEEGVAAHNARQGRLSATANGRSFDETFAESYAKAPIQKATEAQRRLWLMGQHVGVMNRANGSLKFHGNVYHSDWMSQRAGEKVVARFDPEDLHSGVEIYTMIGEYLGFAECQQATGFFDVTGARLTAKRRAQIRRAEKALAKAHTPVPIEEIGTKLDQIAPAPAASLEAKVVAMPQVARRPADPDPSEADTIIARERAEILNLSERRQPEPAKAETGADRFWKAREILLKSEEGKPIGTAEANWLRAYISTPEDQTNLHLFETHGAKAVR